MFGAIMLALAPMIARGGFAESDTAELRLHFVSTAPGKPHAVPAVIWLEPVQGTAALSFPSHGRFTLTQKNRMFTPHLLVVPVGAAVQFPNADPFFHNVFSLFEGKRFDLGLYEAGSSKSVTFSREGVSYIFCNIHPEMSAVVLALSTPLYAVADANNAFALRNIPPGDYQLHIWIEGIPQSVLEHESRPVRFPPLMVDLGELAVPISRTGKSSHTNEFGNSYDPEPHQPY
jgi:plastocyanin